MPPHSQSLNLPGHSAVLDGPFAPPSSDVWERHEESVVGGQTDIPNPDGFETNMSDDNESDADVVGQSIQPPFSLQLIEYDVQLYLSLVTMVPWKSK